MVHLALTHFRVDKFLCFFKARVTDFGIICRVSSIESKSSHPMAAALVDYARSLAIEPVPENVEDFQNFPGEGIFGKIHGNEIYIGNRRIGPRTGCSKGKRLQ